MEHIIKEVQSGNTELFEKIILAYQNRIYCYILKMIANSHIAEELTQDVFLTAYTKLNIYQNNDAFKAWLYKIARNKTLNFIKRKNFQSFFICSQRVEDLYYEESFDDTYFDEKVEYALIRLKPQEKNLLILKSVEELTYKELAVIYNTNQSTIRKRYERAKKKFRKYYEEQKEEVIYARAKY